MIWTTATLETTSGVLFDVAVGLGQVSAITRSGTGLLLQALKVMTIANSGRRTFRMLIRMSFESFLTTRSWASFERMLNIARLLVTGNSMNEYKLYVSASRKLDDRSRN